jgi:hypothetical protein
MGFLCALCASAVIFFSMSDEVHRKGAEYAKMMNPQILLLASQWDFFAPFAPLR